jgi:Flp pilus assembly protein TadG
MKPPFIRRPRRSQQQLKAEHGVTMVLVAVAMVAIIGIAALSIDVITLYLAREEAQRSADAAALAAARIISVSGITGDPTNASTRWSAVCGGSSGVASQAAQAVGMQNSVGGPAPTVTVTYAAGSGGSISSNADCSSLAATTAFGVNPIVTVQIRQPSLPSFFSRLWGTTGNSVTATAAAEAFNSSDSGNSGNQITGSIIPVQPRCVKPWVVPNLDPRNPDGCTTNCTKFVDRASGAIQHAGISLNGVGTNGTIGETFWLESNCVHNNPSSCSTLRATPIQANFPRVGPGSTFRQDPPNLLFWPNQVGTPVTAVPSCSLAGDPFEQAVAGCDAPTNYQCGVTNANVVDLGRNPDYGSTSDGVSCLIHQSNTNDTSDSSGQDYFTLFGRPSTYPFQIQAGSNNPLGISGTVSNSSSIVSLPIYDDPGVTITPGGTTPVTFVGFLQVFINAVDQYGNVNVTVLNVVGCGNGTNATGTPVSGSSPVPVRLITAP